MPEQIQSFVQTLQGLGPKRLGLIGGIVALVLSVVVVGSIYLNKPAYETLYVGLERGDVNQIGMVLGEAGIAFDVGSDGTTVLVQAGKTAQARMLLAEKGLPTSANAGYELFDNVGSLGLTSFMQQVTRVRALEGEIARTIQSIAGIRAARVHLVMEERANFRREGQKPSASVVIRTSGIDPMQNAMAIRYLVAAAVPGLDAENVTVLDSTGNLLATGADPSNSTASRALGIERTIEAQIEDNIRRALAPYLGSDNFRASVRADVNTDSRQTEETIFDPESRVERSVQVVKAAENSSQRSSAEPASVDQNLPETQATPTDGPQSSEESERKEETTNYEINSKRIATVSNGYSINRMSIAVIVNQKRLTDILGANATADQINERVAAIQQMVASATGYAENRGDLINVSAVEFLDGLDGAEAQAPGMFDGLSSHLGTAINAAAFIVVVLIVAFAGLRPMVKALAPQREAAPADAVAGMLADPGATLAIGQDAPVGTVPGPSALDDLRQKIKPAPQERLARMVDLNEERTALILRKWAGAGAA